MRDTTNKNTITKQKDFYEYCIKYVREDDLDLLCTETNARRMACFTLERNSVFYVTICTMSKQFVGTAREQFFYHNTLLCLVKALEGRNVTMDLLHNCHVCGEVAVVDGYMNISFGTAVFCDGNGNEFLYDNLFVQGRNIRYIHIPENISAVEIMKDELNRNKTRNTSKKPEQKSRKAKKALQRHMETVASLQECEKPETSFV